MKLHLLTERCGSAAENMATDFLLLQHYPEEAVRLRHYDWSQPAITFGYGQKLALVREQLTALGIEEPFELMRRATGGGVVDHRNDWTYALVIPRGHELEARPASQSYQLVHNALAAALAQQGLPAVVKLREAATDCDAATHMKKPRPADVCFQRAECFDVIRADTGEKMAGAAQKRTKRGLLFQGSVSRAAAGGEATDWEQFYADFAAALSTALAVETEAVGWPDFPDAAVEGLMEQYASPEWLAYR
ncbi:hypothetical protein AXK11_01655 [Cephaloticoccus primus]|uniref:BPL/LPL catalytic domain-containing protein n=1 Tax=Cephaloticoccus primus TaxID=1548207 RepID=A0A139STI9_9BACT|nr:lipoate--protein ligase family protein [Cephaloticoccus primus]KXU37885.1 hypothetical protein AXK11_01655 [Cephaloticoccus primus]